MWLSLRGTENYIKSFNWTDNTEAGENYVFLNVPNISQ